MATTTYMYIYRYSQVYLCSGAHWAILSRGGHLWDSLGPCGRLWAVVGRGLVGPPGPLWAGPLWAPLGFDGPPWALMGRALVGRPGPLRSEEPL